MIKAVMYLISKGGWIMIPIIITSLIIWIIGFIKIYKMYIISKAHRKFFCLHNKNFPMGCNTGYFPYDLLIQYFVSLNNVNFLENFFKEFLMEVKLELSKGLSTMSVLITVAPLLGLLGTVVGMIETFNIITIFGVGDPTLTAEGISIALLTTEAGLIAAFPGMLLYNFIRNRKEKLQRKIFSDINSLLMTIKR